VAEDGDSSLREQFVTRDGDGNVTAIQWSAFGKTLLAGSVQAWFLGLIGVLTAIVEQTTATFRSGATGLREFIGQLLSPEQLRAAAEQTVSAIDSDPLAFLFAVVIVGVTLVLLGEVLERL